MTPREKYLVIAGLVLGLTAASVLFGVSRLIRPESSAARTEEGTVPAYQSNGDSTPPQHSGHHPGSAASSEATEPAASVQMTEDEQRSIGLQTAVVQHRMIRRELMAAGG